MKLLITGGCGVMGSNLAVHALSEGIELHASLLFDDQKPFTVRINPRVAHSLMGVGHSDYVMMAYTDVRYDAADTIASPPIGIEPGDDPVRARN